MRNSPELYEIWQQVHSQARVIGKKTPSLVNAGIVDWAKENGQYGRIREMVTSFLAKEKVARDGVKQLSLAPPKSSELYERVEPKSELVDVGVGDGKRLARYAGYFGYVKGVDSKKKEMVPDWPKNWEVEIGMFQYDGRIITSFLAYSQFDRITLARVQEVDGIHVVPYHPGLKALGVVEQLGGGRIKTDMGKEVFEENELGDLGGELLRSYYMGINTYAPRDVEIRAAGRKQFKPAGCRYFARMKRDLFIDEFTPKYDGVYMELTVKSGRFVLKDNVGQGVWGEVTSPDMVLHLEMLKDRYVLLRVEKFRTFRPFHSLGMLEKFVDRVKIKIHGKNVVAPERISDVRKWREECPLADGVVCRDGGMDYVMNCGTHLDLEAGDELALTTFLREKIGAKTVEHRGDRKRGIHQVCVQVLDSGRAVCAWRARMDKKIPDHRGGWLRKFQLLTIERYLLKFEKDKRGVMVWEENDGTDD